MIENVELIMALKEERPTMHRYPRAFVKPYVRPRSETLEEASSSQDLEDVDSQQIKRQ